MESFLVHLFRWPHLAQSHSCSDLLLASSAYFLAAAASARCTSAASQLLMRPDSSLYVNSCMSKFSCVWMLPLQPGLPHSPPEAKSFGLRHYSHFQTVILASDTGATTTDFGSETNALTAPPDYSCVGLRPRADLRDCLLSMRLLLVSVATAFY